MRERLDSLKVHIYLGAKVAAAGDPANEDVADARRLLANVGAAGRAAGGEVELRETLDDTVALLRATLALRRLGRAEFGHYPATSDDSLFMREVFGSDDGDADEPPEAVRAVEHAFLTLLLVIGKVHPRTPVPVPVELILYEARVTDADELASPFLAHLLRSARAFVYGSEDFCDLASTDTAWLSERPPSFDQTAAIAGLGRVIAHAPRGGAAVVALVALPPALQLAAHGSTAACFHAREDTEAMDEEIRRAVDVAASWGVPESELALARAYLAYRDDDFAEARRQLELAERSELLDDEGRRDLRELRRGLETDPGLFTRYYNQAFFLSWALRVSVARLDEAGVFDAIWDWPAFVRLRAMLTDARVAIEQASDRLPEASADADDWLRGVGCGGGP